MVSVLTERVIFPASGLEFVIKPLTNIRDMAYVRRHSQVRGRMDSQRAMVFTLVACVIEPKLTPKNALTLIESHPEEALRLVVRIAEITG